ncbi:transglutaminase domain-containing protein [Ancylomarina euxinus]|uniref:Transglutaminase domain-containing protein n=1 Tax=Ancylomarina euxinus TaxID=2283627 RepID=A0A425Y1N8_9BACT|nr:transglutaminase-like domain-containing protein [Ancylomarina euxinus]MCZ4695107.1 transglutaminase-like domain-containing protein [Ancylomarina euxinus]MUP14957.1 transglutaminase domain-containing protein [Ancylomarina euxinus]RRG21849.1 transglutaminase domain-containing protein [Ancylomarina euxinus]
MRKHILLILCLFSLINLTKGQDLDVNKLYQESEMLRKEAWSAKNYTKAIESMLPVYEAFTKLDESEKRRKEWIAQSVSYNLTCAYSLIDNKEKALEFLELNYQHGNKNYYHILKDSDLDNIRDEAKFKELLKLFRLVGDHKLFLQTSSYSKVKMTPPKFTYQNADELSDLRLKYKLDSVAGEGDEFSKIVKLMSWVNHTVRHDGNSNYSGKKSAEALISICEKEKRGVNCRMMSTILNEVYLAMGFKSRFVTCMPKGERFSDCHVINVVYSNQYNKWLWMDASFEAYVMDENNTPLSIQEVRDNLIHKRTMKVYKKLHWNDQAYYGGEQRYLYEYMTKNLYRFSTPLDSRSSYESSELRKTYVELYPSEYKPDDRALNQKVEWKSRDMYFLTDANNFWVNPN